MSAALTEVLDQLEREAAMCGRHENDAGLSLDERASLRRIEQRIAELRQQLAGDR